MNNATQPFAAGSAGTRPGWSAGIRRWAALPVILAGAFMTTLDFFIVNVAIPSMQRELHADTAAIQLVVAGYGVALAAGQILLAVSVAAIGNDGPITWLIPALVVGGAGMGMVVAPLTSGVLAGVAPRHVGAASGLLNTAVQIGGALGVALIGVIFYGSLGSAGLPSAYSHAFIVGQFYLIAVALAVVGLVQLLPREESKISVRAESPGRDTIESSPDPTIEPVVTTARESAA